MLTGAWSSARNVLFLQFHAMSEEQMTALLALLKVDAGLLEKLNNAADIDTAVAAANEAGFDVSKADWLKYQAKQTLELNDEELEGVTGGKGCQPYTGII